MAEGSVGSVWHKSFLPSITVDLLFPSFLVRRKLMKMQFFARSFSIFILISPINRAKRHTVRRDCLHGMPRFHITFAKIAISWLRPIHRSPDPPLMLRNVRGSRLVVGGWSSVCYNCANHMSFTSVDKLSRAQRHRTH